MKSSFWTPYISDHTIHSICWTLIHSLWIGLAIALLSGLVITITRKSSAALRYNLLCSILVLFTLSVGVTFYLQMRTPAGQEGMVKVGQFINGQVKENFVIVPAAAPHLSIIDRTVMLLNAYSNIIFMAWLLLFVLKSLKMAGGLLYIQRIRTYKVHEVADEFKHKIEVFSNQIGIKQAVKLVQSELVKIPVAVGWLKPVILLPMGILLQLSPEQLDSILWHELAHVRRRDYLVNILQGLVETVFFFNPGLLWLSSLIRAEREACCDDMVLSRTNRKANYLEALLAFGNEDSSRMPLAMSIGSGNQLRDRLKRMVNKENKRLNMAEKVVLLAGLIILSAFTTLPKTTQNAVKHLVNVMIKRPAGKDTTKRQVLSTDAGRGKPETTSGKPEMLTVKLDTPVRFSSVLFKRTDSDMTNNDIRATTVSGIKYHLVIKDSKLMAVDVDGEKVPDSQLSNYEYMVTLIKAELDTKRHIRETDMVRFKANQPNAKFKTDEVFYKSRYVDQRLYKDSIYNANLQKMREIIADLVTLKIVPDAGSVKWFALTDSEFIVNGQKQSAELQQRYEAKYGIHAGYGFYYGPAPVKGIGVFIDPIGRAKAERFHDSIQVEDLKAKYGTDDGRRALRLQMMSDRRHNDSIKYSGDRNRALSVIAGLVADKVVPNAEAVKWFGLSNTEFIVNGKKQPDEVQQRYKAKYGIHENYGLYYGPVQMTGTGVFIDDDAWANHIRQLNARKDMGDQRKKIMPARIKQPLFADTGIGAQQRKMSMFDQQRKRLFKTSFSVNDMIASVTNDLVSENVLKDKSDLSSFKLTNSFLVVNGKQQPEEVHQKLRDKYLASPKYSISPQSMVDPHFGLQYNAKTGSMGLGISIDPGDPAVK